MKKKSSGNNIEILVLLIIIFFLFVGLVLMYEDKIDELENTINEYKEVCYDR